MMPLIAQTFGRYFGPINKMPSPKAGCVVPARTNIAPIVSRLRNTVQIVANKTPFFMCGVGNESHKDEELIKNQDDELNYRCVEKPKIKDAKSNYAIIGRYILPKTVLKRNKKIKTRTRKRNSYNRCNKEF